MFVVKCIGAGMLALAGWYAGGAICNTLTVRRVALGEIITLLKTLEEEISFRRANLNVIYQKMLKKNMFSHISMESNLYCGQVKGQSFQTLCPPACLKKEEKEVFTDCFIDLGHAGAEQECERIVRYCKQFEGFYQIAQQREREALAIDRKIGLAIGSMLALVLL